MYADDLVLRNESEEDLKVMVRHFVEVCRRRSQKVNTDKIKLMVLGGEKGLECEIRVDRARLDQLSKFKYLGGVLD